jgi:hypothetical protein
LDAPPPPPPKWPGYSREWYAALLLELDGRLTVEIARRPDFWPAILWAIHLGYHWADARWRLNRGASTQIGATLREKNRAGGRAQAAKLHKHAPQWREWVRQETSRPAHRRLSNARLATMLAPRLKAATEITVTPRTIRRFLSEIRRNKAGR